MKPNREVTLTLKFVVGGILWILFSDYILNYLGRVLVLDISHFQVLKGLFFIGVTGAIIFLVLHNDATAVRSMQDELDGVFRSNSLPMAFMREDSFRFVKVNQSAQDMFGLTAKEFIGLTLRELSPDESPRRIEESHIFIKTGLDTLGVWKFPNRKGNIFSAEVMVRRIGLRDIFLISFIDVTEQVRIQHELSQTNRNLQHHIAKRTDYLERENEELAYRASQTDHVNTELIAVNEQLLNINKRVALENERLAADTDRIRKIFLSLREVVCSYNLSSEGCHFLSPGGMELFEVSEEELAKPWFWLDFVHPEDQVLKEAYQRKVFEKGEGITVVRIITPVGSLRKLLIRTRVEKNEAGTMFLVGAFSDISSFPEEHINRYLDIKTA